MTAQEMNANKKTARFTGLLYLLVAIFAGFAYGYVLGKMYVPGDAATTAANVLANPGLLRLGVVADLAQATISVLVALGFYRLFKQVNKDAASLIVLFISISAAIMCLSDVFQFAADLVATNTSYAAALGTAGANGLVLLLLDMQHYGFLFAQIFFALWLMPMGYLAFKSGMFPKGLGVMLNVGAACYLIDFLAQLLVPAVGAQIHGIVGIAPTIAELWMVGYLLIKGVRVPAAARQGKTNLTLDQQVPQHS